MALLGTPLATHDPSRAESVTRNATALLSDGRVWTRGYVRILAIQALFGLSFSAFLLLPKFLRVELSASATEIGWVAGAAVIMGALSAPLMGPVSARVHPRALLLFGVVSSAAAALCYLAVERVGPLLYALRVVQGLSYVVVFNTTATIVADRVPAARLGQAIGYLGLSMLATNALAPALTEPLAAQLGWGIAFGSAGVLALIAVPLVRTLEDAPPPRAALASSPELATADPRLLAAYYASGLVGLGLGTMFTFVQPFALSLGAGRLGDFFFGYVGAAVVMRLLLAKLVDRVGTGRVALAALTLYGVVVLSTLGLRPSLLSPFGIGIGVAHGLIYPALTAFALADVGSKQRGTVMGWFTSAYHVGFAISVLGFGPLADAQGFPIVFLIAGLCVLTGLWPLGHAVQGARRSAPVTPRVLPQDP